MKPFRDGREVSEVWTLNFAQFQVSTRQLIFEQSACHAHTPFTFPLSSHSVLGGRRKIKNPLSELLPPSHFPSPLSCLPDRLSVTRTSNRCKASEMNRIALTAVLARGAEIHAWIHFTYNIDYIHSLDVDKESNCLAYWTSQFKLSDSIPMYRYVRFWFSFLFVI